MPPVWTSLRVQSLLTLPRRPSRTLYAPLRPPLHPCVLTLDSSTLLTLAICVIAFFILPGVPVPSLSLTVRYPIQSGCGTLITVLGRELCVALFLVQLFLRAFVPPA